MRTVVLKDHAIDKDECLSLLDEFSEFFKKHTGIECEWYVEGYDFSRVPTVPDSDGDLKPTRDYRWALETEVHNRYGDYGVDNIVMLVHEKHFTFAGIWGTNWSGNFYKYSFQLCRWDKRNSANTFGTLYHELMHSFDWVIRDEGLGDIHPEFINWDKFVVHGGRPDMVDKTKWKYIRYQENTKALKEIADRLDRAYKQRKEKHFAPVKVVQWKVINLLKTLIARLKK